MLYRLEGLHLLGCCLGGLQSRWAGRSVVLKDPQMFGHSQFTLKIRFSPVSIKGWGARAGRIRLKDLAVSTGSTSIK